MEIIKLKSSVHWCKHELHSLAPMNPNAHPEEKVFKFITPHRYELIIGEKSKLPIGIAFSYGPVLYVGQVNEQIGFPLKEICKTINTETGEELTPVLVFDYGISSNE